MSALPNDRWHVTGTITTLAPLSIRTGEEEERQGHEGAIQGIEKDHEGKPFIPGSALKGLIRRTAAMRECDADVTKALLGDMPRDLADNGIMIATGGAAEFRNSFAPNWSGKIPHRGRTAIDRGSGTADDGMLRTEEFVPPDTRFNLDILIDRADEAAVALLIGLLSAIDGTDPSSSLGSGDGRVKIEGLSVKHWGKDEVQKWLKDGGDWRCFGKVKQFTAVAPALLGQSRSFPITLQIAGHFLVGEHQAKKQKDRDGKSNLEPYVSRGGAPKFAELPASAIDGPLRAQAERIWRTVKENPNVDWTREPPPGPIEELFGSRDRRGLFTPSDFIGEAQKPVKIDAIAIDRLSHSVASGPFSVSAFEAPALSGTLTINFAHRINPELTGQPSGLTNERCLSPAALGLLALVLRDLAEGDIALGHGTRKGMGEVKTLKFGEGGLTELLEAIGSAFDPTAEPRDTINAAVKAFIDDPAPKGASA
jgi:CRISPR/Cas system CSM-associated protein Csm3 (group 7 of RAMP superfamily)